MKFTARMNAGPHERFSESFARSLIGQRPKFNAREFDGGPVTADYGHCTVVGAELVDDGRAVLVTYEPEGYGTPPTEDPTLLPERLRGLSVGPVEEHRFDEQDFRRFMTDNAETLRRFTDGQP